MPKRLTSLAIVIALSGSPAVLSACMALCLQGVATASHTDSQSAGHAAHLAAAAAGASAHAHHGSPVSTESAATATTTASLHGSSDARLIVTCTNCCCEGQTMLVAGRGVKRIDAKPLSATPIVSRTASIFQSLPGLGESPPSPPVPPPSPTRAPLILRI